VNEANILAGTHRCLFGSEEAYCGAPAVAHVWLRGDLMTMSCGAHVGWWWDHTYLDLHPISPACGIPDTIWRYSRDGDPGWCEPDGFGVVAAEEFAMVGGEPQ
jgi:hypothetical protein